MIRRPIPRWLVILLGILGVVSLLTVYGGLSYRQSIINEKQKVIPGLQAFLDGVSRMTTAQGTEETPKPSMLVTDLRATYWRLFLGIGLGVVLSVVVGIAMGAYRWIAAPLAPIISFFAKIPPTAMLPIYFVLVGSDQTMFTTMVALGIFFTMAQSVYLAIVNDVKDEAIDKAYTLGASDPEIIYEVIWKQVLPPILDNIRLQIGPAMIFLLAAEMLVGAEGMGYRIRMESRVLNMSIVYIYLCIFGFTGLLGDWCLLWLRKKFCPWYDR
jgi:NitT/TauT family transport system permease protein